MIAVARDISGAELAVIKRVPLRNVRYAQNHSNITDTRLRTQTRKPMWITPHSHHAGAPHTLKKLKSAAIVLSVISDGKVSLIAGVTADLTSKIKAGELVNYVATQVGGKGGGRPDMAQAGGTDPTNLPQALESVHDWVAQRA